MSSRSYTYRWWDGPTYRQATFDTKGEKDDFVAEVRRRRRGSYVSLLAAEGDTLLEVSRFAGHSVQTCEIYYAKIFDDVDPAKRVPAEQAIRAAREPGVSGVARLFDVSTGGP